MEFFMGQTDVKKVSVYSDDYPELLKQIYDPPDSLYIRGPLAADAVYIAMVGTRTPSLYGLKMAYKTAAAITERGGVVASGLAFGIDAACHQAAVDLKRPTVAVIASGINHITPRTNGPLAESIIKCGGAVISEYREGEQTLKYRYLRRNRIISGLCKATIVIEAGDVSGALITARHAFEQNRDVYALAGDIDRPQGGGCRQLFMRDIAKPFFYVENLLNELGFAKEDNSYAYRDINAQILINALRSAGKDVRGALKEGISPDNLQKLTGLTPGDLNSALSILEMDGLIKRNPRGVWTIDPKLKLK